MPRGFTRRLRDEIGYRPTAADSGFCSLCFRCVHRGDVYRPRRSRRYIRNFGRNPHPAVIWWCLVWKVDEGLPTEHWAGPVCQVCDDGEGAPVDWPHTADLENWWASECGWVTRSIN